jgi:hypothetical protein
MKIALIRREYITHLDGVNRFIALLAEAIIMLFNDENLGTKLGAEGRKNILIWSEITTKIVSIYEQA